MLATQDIQVNSLGLSEYELNSSERNTYRLLIDSFPVFTELLINKIDLAVKLVIGVRQFERNLVKLEKEKLLNRIYKNTGKRERLHIILTPTEKKLDPITPLLTAHFESIQVTNKSHPRAIVRLNDVLYNFANFFTKRSFICLTKIDDILAFKQFNSGDRVEFQSDVTIRSDGSCFLNNPLNITRLS